MGKNKQEESEKQVRTRKTPPVEEKAKRGRAITWLIFFASLLFAYFFWLQY